MYSKILLGIRKIAKLIATLVAILAFLFALYLGWFRWETRSLKALCSEVQLGMPVSSLPQLAEKYGFSQTLRLENGVPDENNNHVAFVATSSSVGEIVCVIHYDQQSNVVSAEFLQ
ncbi:MAG: hypothetical protein ACOH1Q_07675 [Thiobacillus sp.]